MLYKRLRQLIAHTPRSSESVPVDGMSLQQAAQCCRLTGAGIIVSQQSAYCCCMLAANKLIAGFDTAQEQGTAVSRAGLLCSRLFISTEMDLFRGFLVCV